MTFAGAKLALFLGDDLLVIRRDARDDIPWPDHWDLPGGGRENGESPAECALRETREEVGLVLRPGDLGWSERYRGPAGMVWFFVAHMGADLAGAVRFGDEGQGWTLMAPRAFCADAMAVPHLAGQVRRYLDLRERGTLT